MQGGLKLFRLFGIDVYLDWSLMIIMALITASLGVGVFPHWHPGWSAGLSLITGFVAAVLFFASVLAHEFSHSLVGRSRGIEVKRITLFIFGGMAQIESEPPDWKAEFWMSIVGPVTSLILGAAFIFLALLVAGPIATDFSDPTAFISQLNPLASLLFWLGPVNIALAVFNLVPGFPLDGGRVLRSIIWGVTGDLRKATRWASHGGQLFAWVLIASGLAMMFGLHVPVFGSGFANGLWIAFIGWFLNSAAVSSYQQLLVKQVLDKVPVAKLMHRDITVVPPDISLEEMVNSYLMKGDQRAFPVLREGRLLGLITLHDVRRVERGHWHDTRVDQVMARRENLETVAPDDDATRALERLSRRGINQLPVLDKGELVGQIRREDILKWLSLFGDVGE